MERTSKLCQGFTKISGDPKAWPNFMKRFEDTTEIYGLSERENINCINNCLQGKTALLHFPNMLNRIIETLLLRYGRSDYVIENMIEKVK